MSFSSNGGCILISPLPLSSSASHTLFEYDEHEEQQSSTTRPFSDGDLYRRHGSWEHVLICRSTGKAKKFAPFGDDCSDYEFEWAISESIDRIGLIFFPQMFKGDVVDYDGLTKSYTHLGFKIAANRIGHWYRQCRKV
jgi:hypothetical protein